MRFSVNEVRLLGRLGKDPEVKNTQTGTVIGNLSIATEESWKDKSGEWQKKTEWHRVVAFGRNAEVVRDYCHKGDLVYVSGSLQTRKWTDQSGQDRFTTEVKADKVILCGGRGGGQQSGSGGGTTNTGGVVGGDDDVPF